MSFILDALRKSENERQRAAVPGISDVPAVVEKNQVPSWTLGVIAVLGIGLVVLSWAWFRDLGPAETADIATPVQEPFPTQATVSSSVSTGEIRSLAREARPAAAVAPATPTSSSPNPEPVAEPTMAGATVLTIAEVQASGVVLPELNLELHVYSSAADQRFVFINSSRYREGESLPEGPRVLSIAEDGVVLDYRNQSFLLPRE